MVLDKIIFLLAKFLDVSVSELSDDTMIFFDYDFEDEDIEVVVNTFNEEFDIEIDSEEFCNFNTLGEMAEYIESLME